ncbi:MAG: hypothetical protein FJX76_28365, partial [Armatimonadetes bacterium]|nr:hypothetical protein [Armatimonadota bacterium]
MATHLLTRSRLFDPDSVAVFGASPHSESLGHRLLRNLRDGGFHGRLVGIHPRGGEAAGIPLQARLEDSVDLALVCVPRDAVPAVLDQCRAAGVRAAAILTSGFAECDAAGALLQQEVRRHAADGMAIVGPNGLGVFNGAGRQGRLVGTFLELAAETRPGVVSLLSQSGGCAALLFDEARRRGLGIAKMASLGNMAGLGFRDLLGYLAQDDATKVIGVFAEDLRDLPPCPKPTVLLIGGRSAAGRQAAMRHTGSGGWEGGALPPDYLLAEDSQAFFDALEVLSRCARPRGRRVAIVGNSGGMLVLAADACAA